MWKKIFIYIIVLFQQIIIINLTFKFQYKNQINEKKEYKSIDNEINRNIKIDYQNNNFSIIRYTKCPTCGFFSYYLTYITCVKNLIINGYIPILDLKTFPNIFNKFKLNLSKENPWEYFFYQPFGLTLKDVIKYAKNINYIECFPESSRPNNRNIYTKTVILNFWHNFSKNYIPIKKNIIKETEILIKKLFKDSLNILGILIRGTDYISIKPKGHPIPPEPEIVIKDVKEFDNKYKYNSFFISTEDNNIRNKLIKEFGNKIKYLLPYRYIKYDYKNKIFLAYNKNIGGNLKNLKIYLMNIIILSKCLDIIACRTNGSSGTFIFTKGFRNFKIYYLGLY